MTGQRRGPEASCVFCGRPIGPDEEAAGRAPMSAHATCADAALADDGHWDAISASAGDGEEREKSDAADRPEGTSGRRGGCLAVGLLLLGIAWVVRRS